ncbi:RtcB family protein [Halodesulfovibrio marinisediminis]|uniref:3'-phosphate/5'-hydroxy nucleic acid ligase n=1 Tax=Halodesulfovibrio marinisediminis DSM 17456 TaxID=1121457 RepID=A0A1N6I315_9BACT|nr:RtcB family protein [Halodesulfovibrio marinisediminis]SIO26412.1 tRNA-splicing ligase RtcB [Halodesulfovibrio marinisediminis DSM 17456]
MELDPRLKLTLPIEEIEPTALDQIEAALKFPFLKLLAIMPDIHTGYALPIGAVALLEDHVWPAAVGYDIGCGMCHVTTGMKRSELPDLEELFKHLSDVIPVGFHELKTPAKEVTPFYSASRFAALTDAVMYHAVRQLGTLGSGNHFIEIGGNKEDTVGITVHSGSRRSGWLVGDFYMRLTKGPVELRSKIGKAYLKDMKWCLQYALDNRLKMLQACLKALGLNPPPQEDIINETHNHAIVTSKGVLHRKGATPAQKGQLGIIPANMRDGVWITRGLGNKEFLCSASHGAGRRLSRTAAKQLISTSKLKEQMKGIVYPPFKNTALLDEAPDAYKKIDEVIARQDGILVDIIDHFAPLLVMKG